jgi:hypothetical protein
MPKEKVGVDSDDEYIRNMINGDVDCDSDNNKDVPAGEGKPENTGAGRAADGSLSDGHTLDGDGISVLDPYGLPF